MNTKGNPQTIIKFLEASLKEACMENEKLKKEAENMKKEIDSLRSSVEIDVMKFFEERENL